MLLLLLASLARAADASVEWRSDGTVVIRSEAAQGPRARRVRFAFGPDASLLDIAKTVATHHPDLVIEIPEAHRLEQTTVTLHADRDIPVSDTLWAFEWVLRQRDYAMQFIGARVRIVLDERKNACWLGCPRPPPKQPPKALRLVALDHADGGSVLSELSRSWESLLEPVTCRGGGLWVYSPSDLIFIAGSPLDVASLVEAIEKLDAPPKDASPNPPVIE